MTSRLIKVVVLILFVTLTYCQTEACYAQCYNQTGCGKNQQCITQLFFCDNSCEAYSDTQKELECISQCAYHHYNDSTMSPYLKNFLKCQYSCINGLNDYNNATLDPEAQRKMKEKISKQEQQRKQAKMQQQSRDEKESQSKEQENANESQTRKPITQKMLLKRKFEMNPYSHTGETLKDIQCPEQKNKKKAFILKGNTHRMIIEYFKSRCDFVLMPDSKKLATDFDFKWCDYHYQHNFKALKEGKQIINHVENLKDLISYKDKIVLTYRDFDKLKLYDFDSTDFHFDTYIFDLKSKEYNEEEKHFFNNVNDGLWITKDPDGSLGLGIQLFKNVSEIKERIKYIKEHQEIQYEKRDRILQYSVIQKYLEKPLLMDNKKIDLRGYVLIASLDPFVVLYQNGFVRKCIKDYDTNFTTFDQNEAYKHLTNRIYQKRHPDYQRLQEDLMLTPPQFEEFLSKEHNFSEEDIQNFYKKGEKTVAYSMMAAKEKFIKKKGIFQLLGVDLIWDENYKVYLIEFNTSAGLYQTLQGHKYVIPQLVQSTMDLVLDTMEDVQQVRQKWEKPEELELGRWSIIINEATGFNVLNENLRNSEVKKGKEDL